MRDWSDELRIGSFIFMDHEIRQSCMRPSEMASCAKSSQRGGTGAGVSCSKKDPRRAKRPRGRTFGVGQNPPSSAHPVTAEGSGQLALTTEATFRKCTVKVITTRQHKHVPLHEILFRRPRPLPDKGRYDRACCRMAETTRAAFRL